MSAPASTLPRSAELPDTLLDAGTWSPCRARPAAALAAHRRIAEAIAAGDPAAAAAAMADHLSVVPDVEILRPEPPAS